MELTVTNRSRAWPKALSDWRARSAKTELSALVVQVNVVSLNFWQWFRKNGCNTICGFEGTCLFIFLDSSMVEHSAVNRRVVGSSPTRGAENPVWNQYWIFLYKYLQILVRYDSIYCAAKRAGQFCSYFKQADEMYGSMVKRLRHHPFTVVSGVQIPLES